MGRSRTQASMSARAILISSTGALVALASLGTAAVVLSGTAAVLGPASELRSRPGVAAPADAIDPGVLTLPAAPTPVGHRGGPRARRAPVLSVVAVRRAAPPVGSTLRTVLSPVPPRGVAPLPGSGPLGVVPGPTGNPGLPPVPVDPGAPEQPPTPSPATGVIADVAVEVPLLLLRGGEPVVVAGEPAGTMPVETAQTAAGADARLQVAKLASLSLTSTRTEDAVVVAAKRHAAAVRVARGAAAAAKPASAKGSATRHSAGGRSAATRKHAPVARRTSSSGTAHHRR